MNILPPMTRHGYRDIVPGTVFRYTNGVVTIAENYFWQRLAEDMDGRPREGGIYRYHAYGDGPDYTVTRALDYKVQSIFACSESPCLPIIVAGGDILLYDSYMRPVSGQGTATMNNSDCCWDLLHFEHRSGVSLATGFPFGRPYVAGSDPSWIPSLVPKVFENPKEPQTESRGLAGDISIVIGLMAFHGPPENPSQVFARHWWQHNSWHGPTSRPAYCKY